MYNINSKHYETNINDGKYFYIGNKKYLAFFSEKVGDSDYAECIIRDEQTGETYESKGYIELNGHIVRTRWEYSLDHTLEWKKQGNLIIEID